MSIFYTDDSFKQYTTNPFDNDRPYTDNWILLKLIEKADDFKQMSTGGNGQIFRFIMTKELIDWKFRMCDFITYESGHNKNIILAVDKEDLAAAKDEYGDHCNVDCFLRDYEQKILVHTTTIENYNKILSCGELKCWNVLKNENLDWEEKPIGSIVNDPANYSDYIMFGTGGVYQELIPLSKQKGAIDMNIDSLYNAGARFYFDAEKIANDGLLVRDGLHLKVKNRLSLNKYLIWIATANELGITGQTTPRIFADTADRAFSNKFGILIDDTCY